MSIFTPLLLIVAAVLILVALKYVSDETKDRSIFNNALISLLLLIVGIVIIVTFIMGLKAISFVKVVNILEWRENVARVYPSITLTGIFSILAFLGATWVLLIVSSAFFKKSLDSTADHLKADLFRTAGLLYLIGAALTIVLVGFIILLATFVLLAVAFLTMPEKVPTAS